VSEVVRRAEVAASPEEVWAVLADFGALASWAGSIDHTCLITEQREGVGTARRVQVGRMVLIERVVRWEPREVLAYELEGLPAIVGSVINTWALTPSGDGTSVSLTTTVDAGSRPPRRLLAKGVARKMGETSDALLTALTDHLETPT
jgi:uncharacterized protein YndB with AHSA1/START domain